MRHLPSLLILILLLLAACAADQTATGDLDAPHLAAASLDTLPGGAVCQIGPDGGPPLADTVSGTVKPVDAKPAKSAQGTVDRGPSSKAATKQGPSGLAQMILADRGIGGTGGRQDSPELADRGIGGTGIVGVVTGFASVCVNGLEVAYDSSASINIDGTVGTPAALRVGQVVVIEAKGPAAAPKAQSITVRSQVTGRIEALQLGTGTLTIAGQPVSVTSGTWGADTARLGDWVAVSGLRRSDGMLVATRLDLAPPGTLAVRGQVVRDGDTVRVGELVLNGSAAAELKTGQYVTVSGQYAAGRAQIRSVAVDPLFANPAAYFGASVNHLVLQAYVRVANGAVYLNGLKVAAAPSVSARAGADGIAIVSLERKGDGAFTATGLRYTDHAGPSPGRVRAPNGDPRTGPVPSTQTRRSGAGLAALGGNTGGPVSGSQQAVASGGGEPAASAPAGSTPGTAGSPSLPSTASVSSPAVTPVVAPPVVVSPLVVAPVVTPPAVAPPTTLIPAGSGPKIESVPSSPNTSHLMSDNSAGKGLTPTSTVPRTASVALHPAITASLASHATINLATQAVTTPAASAAVATVVTPAVLAPTSSSSGITPTGTRGKSLATGGGAVRGH